MKKFVLSSLLVGLTFIGFSNASVVTCNHIDGTDFDYSCSPSVSYRSDCENSLKVSSDCGINTLIGCFGSDCSSVYLGDDPSAVYNLDDIITSNFSFVPSILKFGHICGNGSQQNFIINTKCYVLKNRSSTFTPVVTGLGVTVTEIVPYVVYISIGFLIAVIGFFVIKWLCNWFLVKINSVFKSKRG